MPADGVGLSGFLSWVLVAFELCAWTVMRLLACFVIAQLHSDSFFLPEILDSTRNKSALALVPPGTASTSSCGMRSTQRSSTPTTPLATTPTRSRARSRSASPTGVRRTPSCWCWWCCATTTAGARSARSRCGACRTRATTGSMTWSSGRIPPGQSRKQVRPEDHARPSRICSEAHCVWRSRRGSGG